ncbi:uncharacterized protein [Aegilops tauschii subsp. strangulata]|uniref:uncharacterized protein n=1 Tax=Aegilops tauschii subsp. strangulata TaxID=200361 RepID=UPI003CC8D032
MVQKEQIGGKARCIRQMDEFRDCLADCGLADIGFSGYPFTWDNKREGGENIQVRLDRATCSTSFMQLFPETKVQHILTKESDHQALLVRVASALAVNTSRRLRPFMYEAAWTRHADYEAMVTSAWEKAHATNERQQGMDAACKQLALMVKAMQTWSREVFGSIKKQISHLKWQLKDAKERAIRTGYRQEIKDLEDQLRDLYEREEIYYKQRSRVDWLQYGDQNTQYFQNRASHRKRKNTIKGLCRDDGTKCTDDDGMREMATAFYA